MTIGKLILVTVQWLRFVAAFFVMLWHTARRTREAEHDAADHGLEFGSGGSGTGYNSRRFILFPRKL